MLRRCKLLVLILAVLLLSASCATEIAVRYMQPSEINMGSYRNLALASVVPYKGFVTSSGWIRTIDIGSAGILIRPSYSYDITNSVASYATDRIYSTLSSSGYYNILPPSSTDRIIHTSWDESREFRDMGYDAVMIPRIDAMNVDESIYTTVDRVSYYDPYYGGYVDDYEYEYHLKRRISITYSITVVDTATERIVTTKTFSDYTSFTETIDPMWPSYNDSEYYFRRMIRNFQEGVIRLFVPTTAYYDVTLMDNNPELAEAGPAYDAVSNGDYQTALSVFLSCWNSYGHAPSGYNAALLIAAQGRYDDAIGILQEVQKVSPAQNVQNTISDLTTVSRRNKEAQAQLAAETESFVIPEEWLDDSIYEYLVR